VSIPHILLFGGALFLAACGGSSYWDTSLDRAELQGKSQAWFEENWGRPSAKAQRFFGGETWIYFQITGKNPPLLFFYDGPSDCQVSLDFDKEGKLKDSDYSGC